MNERRSIRDELADLIPLGFTDRDPDSNVLEAADRILASPVIRRIQAEALRTWADEMDNTDDPDWVHVANGNIDLWLHCVADRIERGGD